ncbi:hypothetical protein COB64_02435 [Candidatus Wolfebacteria bacterium]|nr:MAG: hypothetical protein COB64_02435 [Candidatus Wolfebacteria bacterium]
MSSSDKFPEEEQIIEKPDILYHGSIMKDLKVIEPKDHNYRDPHEGALIFAAPDLALATIFITKRHHSGYFNDVPFIVIDEHRESFIKKDKGGAVYVLSSENFKCDSKKGMQHKEWTCDIKVKPKEKIDYPSTLDAMLENGVQVYFVDNKTYEQVKSSDDGGLAILKDLKSENEERQLNYKTLP